MKNKNHDKNASIKLQVFCVKCGNKAIVSIDEELPLQCPHCGRRTKWILNKIETNKNLENTEKVKLVKALSNWKKDEIWRAWERSFDDRKAKFELLYTKALGIGMPLYRENIDLSHELVVTQNRIWLLKKNGGDVKDKLEVVRGHFKPLNRIELDGELLFEVEMHEKIIGNAKEIFQRLQIEGNITDRKYAPDAINRTLLGMAKNTIHGHAAFGVYLEENDELRLCLNPIPRTESQKQVFIEVNKKSEALTEQITTKKLTSWIEILHFWEDYEIFPIMGISIMSPFALELRKKGFLFPYLYHYSPESGLGKTATVRIFTEMLFGKKVESADAVNSKYRLADSIDCYGGLIAINEAEKFAWKAHIAHIMNATENEIQDRRGTPNLGSRQYFSRATFVFTGNKFPLKDKPKLIRFLKIEFDPNKKSERNRKENRAELYNAIKKLKPIGWRLIELELGKINYDIERLIDNINYHANKIEDFFSGVFEDGRRAIAWSIVYEGLKVWEYACKKHGIEWHAPSYEEFVANVVKKVEKDTFESKEIPAEDFIAWWESWKAKNVIRVYETGDVIIKGKEKIWDEKMIKINRKEVVGDIITNAVLREYRRDGGELQTMSELAKGVSLLFGISVKEIYKAWRIGGKVVKAVFIPSKEDKKEEEEQKQNDKPQEEIK